MTQKSEISQGVRDNAQSSLDSLKTLTAGSNISANALWLPFAERVEQVRITSSWQVRPGQQDIIVQQVEFVFDGGGSTNQDSDKYAVW